VTARATEKRRFVEIDALKALGIVAVVLIHGLRSPWDETLSQTEVWLGHLTRFAVPSFLLASGFLYATTEDVPIAITLRRLRRVLVPYLLASLGAQAWWAVSGGSSPTGSMLRDLLFGSSFGPYYYVFVVVWLILLTPLLVRLPRPLLFPVAGVLIAAQWMVDAAVWLPVDLYVQVRSPLLWWAYFLLGWLLRVNRATFEHWVVPHRARIAIPLAVTVALLTWTSAQTGPFLLVRSAAWLEVYAILALVLTLTVARSASPPAVRWLADATYAIYLLHLFFVYPLQRLFPPPPLQAAWLPILAPWLGALAGSIALVALLQRLLGKRSRDLIGA
jgi:surface polysaccharide O-acyltransferase-like enzyme